MVLKLNSGSNHFSSTLYIISVWNRFKRKYSQSISVSFLFLWKQSICCYIIYTFHNCFERDSARYTVMMDFFLTDSLGYIWSHLVESFFLSESMFCWLNKTFFFNSRDQMEKNTSSCNFCRNKFLAISILYSESEYFHVPYSW